MGGLKVKIYIDNRQDKVEIDQDIYERVEDAIRETLLFEKESSDYEISVCFVNNKEIKALNKEYRNIDEETDVLSFPLEEDFIVPIPLLGDIIISAEKALDQSKEYNHSLTREIVYLTLHSTLHLLGYDHMDKDEKSIMRDKEKEVIKRLKLFKDGRED